MTSPGLAGVGTGAQPGSQTAQDRQLAFLNAPTDRRTIAADRIMAPASPYVLQEGAVITAAPITGISSALPGQTTPHGTENHYDSAPAERRGGQEGGRKSSI